MECRRCVNAKLYQLGIWKAAKTFAAYVTARSEIIPTGDLEGCQDGAVVVLAKVDIIPTGDLEGCQD